MNLDKMTSADKERFKDYEQTVFNDIAVMIDAGVEYRVVPDPNYKSQVYGPQYAVVLDPRDVSPPLGSAVDVVTVGRFWKKIYAQVLCNALNDDRKGYLEKLRAV